MEWTDIRLTVSKADAEAAEAVATMIAEGGIYIEDYSDIEEQVEQIAHVDLIEQELLEPRSKRNEQPDVIDNPHPHGLLFQELPCIGKEDKVRFCIP